MRNDQSGAGEETCRTTAAVSGSHHGDQEVRQRPQGLTVTLLCRRGDEDANDGTDDGVGGGAGDLTPDGVSGSFREPRIVGLIQDARGDTSDGADDAVQDHPAHRCVLDRGFGGYRTAEPVHGRKGPDEQDDLEDEDRCHADVQEDFQFMRPDPDQGQGDQTENDVAQERGRRQSRGVDVVGDAIFEVRPDGFETNVDALSADPGLHGVPNQRKEDAVVNDET